jgi:hypothetical protein
MWMWLSVWALLQPVQRKSTGSARRPTGTIRTGPDARHPAYKVVFAAPQPVAVVQESDRRLPSALSPLTPEDVVTNAAAHKAHPLVEIHTKRGRSGALGRLWALFG